MNDLFLFGKNNMTLDDLCKYISLQKNHLGLQFNFFEDGIQINYELLMVSSLVQYYSSEIYLEENEKAKFLSFYCLSYRNYCIDKVLNFFMDFIDQYDMLICADEDNYEPRYSANDIDKAIYYFQK